MQKQKLFPLLQCKTAGETLWTVHELIYMSPDTAPESRTGTQTPSNSPSLTNSPEEAARALIETRLQTLDNGKSLRDRLETTAATNAATENYLKNTLGPFLMEKANHNHQIINALNIAFFTVQQALSSTVNNTSDNRNKRIDIIIAYLSAAFNAFRRKRDVQSEIMLKIQTWKRLKTAPASSATESTLVETGAAPRSSWLERVERMDDAEKVRRTKLFMERNPDKLTKAGFEKVFREDIDSDAAKVITAIKTKQENAWQQLAMEKQRSFRKDFLSDGIVGEQTCLALVESGVTTAEILKTPDDAQPAAAQTTTTAAPAAPAAPAATTS